MQGDRFAAEGGSLAAHIDRLYRSAETYFAIRIEADRFVLFTAEFGYIDFFGGCRGNFFLDGRNALFQSSVGIELGNAVDGASHAEQRRLLLYRQCAKGRGSVGM